MSSKFKVGDRVVRLTKSMFLTVGKEYRISALMSKGGVVALAGSDYIHDAVNFKLVNIDGLLIGAVDE